MVDLNTYSAVFPLFSFKSASIFKELQIVHITLPRFLTYHFIFSRLKDVKAEPQYPCNRARWSFFRSLRKNA